VNNAADILFFYLLDFYHERASPWRTVREHIVNRWTRLVAGARYCVSLKDRDHPNIDIPCRQATPGAPKTRLDKKNSYVPW